MNAGLICRSVIRFMTPLASRERNMGFRLAAVHLK